jgi:sugar (pentulose or hexulose) kinase
MIHLGIDLGASFIKATCVNFESGIIMTARKEAPKPIYSKHHRFEIDPKAITDSTVNILKEFHLTDLDSVVVCGQMHGMLVVDEKNEPISNFVSWQDTRCNERVNDERWIDLLRKLVGKDYLRRSGIKLYPGLMIATLFYLKEKGLLPKQSFKVVSLAEFITAFLSWNGVYSDHSNASSTGFYNIEQRNWDIDTIHSLGLTQDIFPPIVAFGAKVGEVDRNISMLTGLPEKTPIFSSIGDHQAALIGGLDNDPNTVILNIGTGAQVSRISAEGRFSEKYEIRPFPEDKYALTIPRLPGGRVINHYAGDLEPIVKAYQEAYNDISSNKKRRLLCTGRAVKKNRALLNCLEKSFEIELSKYDEESALGCSILGSVYSRQFNSIADCQRFLKNNSFGVIMLGFHWRAGGDD